MSSRDQAEELLDLADGVYEEGSEDEILATMERLRRILKAAAEDPDLVADLRYSLAAGAVVLGDHRTALDEYRQLRALGVRDAELEYWEAVSLFHTWSFDEARARLRDHSATEETAAGAMYYAGLLWEYAGEWDRADAAFQRAHALDPEGYARPFRMSHDAVEAMLRELVASLPADVAQALHNVQISLAPLPEPAVHAHPDIDPLVLGLYTGLSLMEQESVAGGDLPERVEVFQRNVERIASDEAELRHELGVTLMHEIGHHLGWDEDDLHERGLG